jgi:hypothetical protein
MKVWPSVVRIESRSVESGQSTPRAMDAATLIISGSVEVSRIHIIAGTSRDVPQK